MRATRTSGAALDRPTRNALVPLAPLHGRTGLGRPRPPDPPAQS